MLDAATGGKQHDMSVTQPDPGGSRLKASLASARAELTSDVRRGAGGRGALERYSDRVDAMLRQLFADGKPPEQVAVLALGGYGRRALCLHSDIDLLVLFGGAIGAAEERYVNVLLQPLWDLGLTVGHHIRERAELDTPDEGNPEFLLALCDLRLIAGDSGLFDDVWAATGRARREAASQRIEALLALAKERHGRFADSLYHLEPDVKETPGGLRDVGAIRLLRSFARDVTNGAPPETARI